MLTACTQGETVLRSLRWYWWFDELPIPDDELIWMECVVDFVQQKIPNFSPYHLKCNPEKYLNFLFMVLSDLEAYNQELAMDLEQNKYKMLKLFTLLPEKKIQPLHIKIDSTCV